MSSRLAWRRGAVVTRSALTPNYILPELSIGISDNWVKSCPCSVIYCVHSSLSYAAEGPLPLFIRSSTTSSPIDVAVAAIVRHKLSNGKWFMCFSFCLMRAISYNAFRPTCSRLTTLGWGKTKAGIRQNKGQFQHARTRHVLISWESGPWSHEIGRARYSEP